MATSQIGRRSRSVTFSYFLQTVLVGLYEQPEKPSDALEYVPAFAMWYPFPGIGHKNFLDMYLRFLKKHLHGGPPEAVDVEALQRQVQDLRQRNQQLEGEVAQLKEQV